MANKGNLLERQQRKPVQPTFNLFKDANGWDFCVIKNGRYIGGSRQGYKHRGMAVNAIRIMNPLAKFQDDKTGVVYTFHAETGAVVKTELKSIKIYEP